MVCKCFSTFADRVKNSPAIHHASDHADARQMAINCVLATVASARRTIPAASLSIADVSTFAPARYSQANFAATHKPRIANARQPITSHDSDVCAAGCSTIGGGATGFGGSGLVNSASGSGRWKDSALAAFGGFFGASGWIFDKSNGSDTVSSLAEYSPQGDGIGSSVLPQGGRRKWQS